MGIATASDSYPKGDMNCDHLVTIQDTLDLLESNAGLTPNDLPTGCAPIGSQPGGSSATPTPTPTPGNVYTLLAADNSYLGIITCNKFATDGIFNQFGTYGNEFSGQSIWNEFGTYGSQFSIYSPFNDFTATPPLILDGNNTVAYLTTNQSLSPRESPTDLVLACFGDDPTTRDYWLGQVSEAGG